MKFASMDPHKTYNPEEIYEKLVEARKKLLSGFPGDGITNMDVLKHVDTREMMKITIMVYSQTNYITV